MAERDTSPAGHNRRLGLWLFAVYLAVYAGFVGLVAYDWTKTKAVVFDGMNLAVAYGFGLIIGAFVIAVVYMLLAKPEAAEGSK